MKIAGTVESRCDALRREIRELEEIALGHLANGRTVEALHVSALAGEKRLQLTRQGLPKRTHSWRVER